MRVLFFKRFLPVTLRLCAARRVKSDKSQNEFKCLNPI